MTVIPAAPIAGDPFVGVVNVLDAEIWPELFALQPFWANVSSSDSSELSQTFFAPLEARFRFSLSLM